MQTILVKRKGFQNFSQHLDINNVLQFLTSLDQNGWLISHRLELRILSVGLFHSRMNEHI